MQYDAFKEWSILDTQLSQAKSGQGISQQDKIRMAVLKKKLTEENETNKKIFDRRRGETIRYGDEL